MYKRFIVFVSVVSCAFGLELPSNFKTCKRDSNINECLKDAIQDVLPKLKDGLPAFNVPSLEPIEVTSLTIGEGKSAVHVVQNYKNAKISGFSKSGTITNVDIKFGDTPTDWIFEGIFSDIEITSDYNFNGRVLLLPIVGSGNSVTKFKNVHVHVEMHVEPFKKNGEEYVEVKKSTITLLPEKMIFNFQNLFNGDARLGGEMNQLLNDNWKEVWDDVRGGYEEALSVIFQDVANKIIKKLPLDKLVQK